MDTIDRAQLDIEQLEEARNKRLRDAKTEKEAEETGYCLFCGEPVPPGRRWCDADCRDEWEREQKLNNIKGV